MPSAGSSGARRLRTLASSGGSRRSSRSATTRAAVGIGAPSAGPGGRECSDLARAGGQRFSGSHPCGAGERTAAYALFERRCRSVGSGGMEPQRGASIRAFVGGLLTANSLGHLATAAAGKEHLTPLAGRRSGPGVNAVWGLLNLGGGLAVVRGGRSHGSRWGPELHAFGAGAAVFAMWMVEIGRAHV